MALVWRLTLWMLIVADVVNDSAACETPVFLTANSTVQSISSPAYPTPYPSDQDVCYVIRTHTLSYHVTVAVVDIRLEDSRDCEGDYVEVIDGSSVYSPPIERWCGTSLPRGIFSSTGRYMVVHFRSDSSLNTYPGFKLLYLESHEESDQESDQSGPFDIIQTRVLPVAGGIAATAAVIFYLKKAQMRARQGAVTSAIDTQGYGMQPGQQGAPSLQQTGTEGYPPQAPDGTAYPAPPPGGYHPPPPLSGSDSTPNTLYSTAADYGGILPPSQGPLPSHAPPPYPGS